MMGAMRALLLSTVCIACACAITLSGQGTAGRTWFDIPTPRGLGDPHAPTVDVSALKPAAPAVPSGETGWTELAGPRIRQDLVRIVEFSKMDRASGSKAWGRITGFPAARLAFDWAAQQFQTAGLRDVNVQRYNGTGAMWTPQSWEAALLPSERLPDASQPLVLESAFPTSGSQITGGSITALLVDTGRTDTPLPGMLDVRDKIAVQHINSAAGAFSERTRTSERARELTGRGAAAVLNIVEQMGNMHVRDYGNCGGPCFNLGAEDGAFLSRVIRSAVDSGRTGDLHMRLTLRADMLAGLLGQNVVGIVPGVNDAENIIVNAHGDGWFDGAGDNGDGFAVVLALARHFAKAPPARTLVFVISGGHHSSGLNGPANFVRMNPALTKKTVLVVNLEHVAQFAVRPTPSWHAEPTEQPMTLGISNQAPFLIDLGKRQREASGFNLNPTFGSNVPGDLGGYEPLGVARVQAIHSGPLYHTSGDTIETISVPGLERAARFFAHFIDEAAKAPRAALNP